MPSLGVKTLSLSHDKPFNGSILNYNARKLLAYRVGQIPASIFVCELDAGDSPIPGTDTRLSLGELSTDDPRLFAFRGRLHVAYCARRFDNTGGIAMYYARLAEDFRVEQIFRLKSPHGQPVEKNWSPFDHDGTLRFVYSIRPHIVLEVEADRIVSSTETLNAFPWSGGHLRGGAPPVRVGERYYHWFHGVDGDGPERRYNVGLYAFDVEPPFRITHFAPHPLRWASDAPEPGYQTASVIFPCGATFDGATWRVSSGVHDREIEVRDYAHAEVAKWLSLPCRHIGEPATASEISRAGLNPVVAHHHCRVGLGLVTDCRTCGKSPKCDSKCLKYDAG